MPAPEGDGDCYKANARSLLWAHQSKLEGWLLCHGRPVLQVEPFCRYGHAWLECPEGHHVRDYSNGKLVEMRRELYYHYGTICGEEVARYTEQEAREKIKEYKHWGPWE